MRSEPIPANAGLFISQPAARWGSCRAFKWNNRSSTRLSSADAGGDLVSHRRFYLLIAGIWIGGGLMLWAAIHLMHVYVFD
jgi:hypothetical protein